MSQKPIHSEVHLIDIENQLGSSHFTASDVAEFRAFYIAFNDVHEDAQFVIATSNGRGLVEAGLGWPGARSIFRHGHDGADLALLEVIEEEQIEKRFQKIVVASGDGIFAEAVACLFQQGHDVEVFSPALSVSHQFENAGEVVRLFGAADFCLS